MMDKKLPVMSQQPQHLNTFSNPNYASTTDAMREVSGLKDVKFGNSRKIKISRQKTRMLGFQTDLCGPLMDNLCATNVCVLDTPVDSAMKVITTMIKPPTLST